MDSNNLTNTLQHLFRTLVPTPAPNQRQRSNNNENAQGQSTSAAPDSTTGTSQTIGAEASSAHTATPGGNLGDVEMSAVDHSNINDDDDEMPELQSVSDSDSEDEDLNEVEMQAHYDGQGDLNALMNGRGGDRLMPAAQTQRHPQSQLSANPASSSTRSLPRPNRRARVEDDHDEERDRRHPSERVNAPRVEVPTPMYSAPAPGATRANTIPTPLNTAPPPQSQPQPQQPRGQMFPELMNMFLQEFRRRSEQRQNQGQQNAQAPPAPQPPQNQNPQEAEAPPTNVFGEEGGPQTTGFAITFDLVNGGEPVVTAGTGPPWAAMGVPGGNGAPEGNGANGRGPPGSRSNPIALDAEALFTFINMLGVIPGGIGGGPEVEDPERAKQLVDALDEVPIGLIRRMERVSEGVDLSGTGGEVNCSICWDRLLDSEGGSGWAKKDEEHDHSHTESEQASGEGSSSSGPAPATSDDAPAPSTEAGPSSTESTEVKQPKIVSLPCAHVFHAACLIPWFSRPRQTTCPACRFNIDPENLTYRPQVRRRPANTSTTPATATTANAAAQTGTDAEQQPQAPAATATAGVQTPDAAGPAPPRAERENVEQTVETLESLRDALTRRIDQAEAEERDLVARIMRGAAEANDLDDEIEITQFEIPQDGSNAAPTPATPPPTTPAETPAAANTADPLNANRSTRTTSILTIGVDVIIGTVGPNMDDLPMDDLDQDQQPNQGQPQAPGQGPNMRRFGAPFGAGLRTGNNGNRQWVGSGRTFNEAFASLFANNNNLGGGPGNATAAPANPPPAAIPIPLVFGPSPPPPAQAQPAPGPRQPPNPSNNGNGRNGPASENFNLGQIFNRLFGGIGGQREAQGQGTPAPPRQPQAQAQPQTQPQVPPTQLPPFLNVNAGLAPSPAAQPTPTAGPTNNNTNLPPLQQHLANIFGGVPGFPPGGAGTAPRTAPGGPGNAPPRPPRERRKWTLPPPPGPTLRQRIEKAEREAGLRCFDVSCGVGPSDEEPFTTLTEAAKKQLSIQDADDKHDGTPHHNVCTHTFHPSCLVSAARVALMGEDAILVDDGKRVEVSCSVCRSEGSVLKNDWDEGVDALM